jgi:hypothetical protein
MKAVSERKPNFCDVRRSDLNLLYLHPAHKYGPQRRMTISENLGLG